MSLVERLNQDLKDAMRARDQVRLTVIRGIKSAVTEAETRKERKSVDDGDVLGIIAKEVKERREVLTEFERAGRTDLVQKALQEIEVLSTYLPEPLSAQEIHSLVVEAVQATGATDGSGLGKVMAWLQPRTRGRADGAEVSRHVKEVLGSL